MVNRVAFLFANLLQKKRVVEPGQTAILVNFDFGLVKPMRDTPNIA